MNIDLQPLWDFLSQTSNFIIGFNICMGYLIKKSPFISNRYIDLLVLLFSVAVTPYFFEPYILGIMWGVIYAVLSFKLYDWFFSWLFKINPDREEEDPTRPRFITPPCYALLMIPLVCLPLVGCATNQTPRDTVVSITPYVRPAVNALCSVVLNSALNESDRKEKAVEMYNLSVIVENLATGQYPTVEQFEKVLQDHVPKKSHWASLTKSLSSLYKGQYPKIVKGDVQVWVDFAGEFVGGIVDATEPYVTDN